MLDKFHIAAEAAGANVKRFPLPHLPPIAETPFRDLVRERGAREKVNVSTQKNGRSSFPERPF